MLSKNKINIIISLSVSTLLISPVTISWFNMVHFPIGNSEPFLEYSNYYYPFKYSHVDYLAILLILIIAPFKIFFIIYFFYKNYLTKLFLEFVFLLILLININIIRRDIYPFLNLEIIINNFLFFLFIFFLIIFVLFYFRNLIRKILKFLLIISSPFYLIFLLNYTYAIYLTKPDESNVYEYNKQLAPINKNLVDNKLILIIFDELDYRLLFEKKQKNLNLPNIDSLLEFSFFSTNAIPPDNETKFSLPQITNGHKIFDVFSSPGNKINIIDDKKNILEWRNSKNIFKFLNQKKINIAIVGHAGLPYCRVFDKYLNVCWEHGIEWNDNKDYLHHALFKITRETLLSFPLLNKIFLQNENNDHFEIQRFKTIMKASKKIIQNEDIDFTLLHFFIPHNPYYYNMDTDSFDTSMFNKPEGYIHSLKLVDNIIGEIIETIKLKYDFNNVNLIITSDHSCRKIYCPILDELNLEQDIRVPFIAKLKNQDTKYIFEEEFRTINIFKIINGILEKKITKPEDLIKVSSD